ncbi:tetratricopeptide repeat protein [Flexithrix dorotheae]|uniref:tetratricopeptide repeat protein n=1 Tax=Flexithrix dorotheae TaxID=70993 RepID=UPI000375B6F2|nr:hypothetical protein [Flexithrix dorotheae]
MNPQLIEKIEAYLDGGLTREQLESQVSEEERPTLDEEIAWLRKSKLAVEAIGLRQQLQDTLSDTSSHQQETKVISIKPERSNRSWYWAAASLTLAVAAFIGLYFNSQPNLYEAHLYQDPGLPILMSQSEKYELYDAMSYFSEGNYEMAVEKFRALEEASGSTDTITYYLGTSLLYQENTTEAFAYLSKIQNTTASSFKEKADWLLVLAYLKNEQPDQVKLGLKDILSDSKHAFYSQAQKLSQEIE